MAHPVDIHVGAKIKQRRQLIGMTQQELADQIGTVPQQVQKYEIAANRISAGRLFDVARALDIGAESFFEGLDGVHASPTMIMHGLKVTREAQQFLRSCYAVPSERRKEFLSLVTALGSTQ